MTLPFRIGPVSLVLLIVALLGSAAPAAVGAAAPPSDWDVTRQGLVWQVPEMARARVRADVPFEAGRVDGLTMDLYYPPEASPGALPGAVVFVNGVGDLPGNPLRAWAIYQDWARAVTTRGLVGITYGAEAGRTAENLAALFEHLKAHGRELGLDPDRLGLYACSANVTTGLPFTLTASGAPLRAAVFFYGNAAVDSLRPDLPVFYVKAQRDGAGLNAGIDQLWQRARDRMTPWTMTVGRGLPHAFDGLDVSDYSRGLVQQALDFWATHLGPLPPAPPNPLPRRVNAAIYAQDFAAAARLLEPEYRAGDSAPDVGRLLLLCYRNLRDLERGLPLAEQQVRLHPDVANLWSGHGALLLAAQRPGDAAASFEKALHLGARDFFTYNQVIMAQLAAGNPAAAVRRGEEAARLFPAMAGIHYNLACAHARHGQPAPAVAALAAAIQAGYRDRKSIESDPDLESLRADPGYRKLMDALPE